MHATCASSAANGRGVITPFPTTVKLHVVEVLLALFGIDVVFDD